MQLLQPHLRHCPPNSQTVPLGKDPADDPEQVNDSAGVPKVPPVNESDNVNILTERWAIVIKRQNRMQSTNNFVHSQIECRQREFSCDIGSTGSRAIRDERVRRGVSVRGHG